MFKKMEKKTYPPRLWALVGFPGSGKTTFAAQMRGPLLPIDADQRFDEVLHLVDGDALQLSNVAADHTDPERIAALLVDGMPGAQVGTIVVDSLTAIIAPLVTRVLLDNEAGLNKNRAAAFRNKALTMRLLQDSITKWGCDVLWIYHLQHGLDAKAQAQVTATVSKTELARLMRSINVKLELVMDDDRRGIKVVWARRGRAYPDVPVLWDDAPEAGGGRWAGMPERIEAAMYDGLTREQQERIARSAPAMFPDDETAINWGFEQGCFEALQHARNTYEKLQREIGATGDDLAALWVADVQERLSALVAATQAGAPPPEEPLSELNEFFSRAPGDEPASSAAPPAEAGSAAAPVDAGQFWNRLGALKTRKRVAFDVDKRPPLSEAIAVAKVSDDWGAALQCLEAQAH